LSKRHEVRGKGRAGYCLTIDAAFRDLRSRQTTDRPMTQTTPSTPPSAAAAAEGLVASYETAGYVRAVPAILQPAVS
jgi:hypothetical protein